MRNRDWSADVCSSELARRLQGNLPAEATVARLGGDEFAVIVPGLAPGSALASAVDAILKGVADTLTIDESVLPVSISAGAAVWPADGDNAEGILKSADLALYAAKDRKSTRLNSSH